MRLRLTLEFTRTPPPVEPYRESAPEYAEPCPEPEPEPEPSRIGFMVEEPYRG